MGEVKNAFIKSKMNKDLDSRLVPSGEYRNAVNVQVSKSEGSDVGAVENSLGNIEISDFAKQQSLLGITLTANVAISFTLPVSTVLGLKIGMKLYITNAGANQSETFKGSIASIDAANSTITMDQTVGALTTATLRFEYDLRCIGTLSDDANSNLYLFFTDFTDPFPNSSTFDPNSNNFIFQYNTALNVSTLLVEGAFLNFSKTNVIYGINILEELLFWTDNRNQPRKINVQLAAEKVFPANPASYYTTEEQISVAKYNPYQAIELYDVSDKSTSATTEYETTMKDVTSFNMPNGGNGLLVSRTTLTVVLSSFDGQIVIPNQYNTLGASVAYINNDNIVNIPNISVDSVAYNEALTQWTITFVGTGTFPVLGVNTRIILNPNPYYNSEFSGNDKYLEDKFVRFGYRFEFDDGEYSIFSTFTQPAFIPKQDGYFIYKSELGVTDIEDMSNTYRSTVVSFAENKVDEIKLRLPLPFKNYELKDKLKIKSVEILYKESDQNAVKVISSVDISTITGSSASSIVTTATTASTSVVVNSIKGTVNIGEIVYGQDIVGTPKVVSFTPTDPNNISLSGTIVMSSVQTLPLNSSITIGNPDYYVYSYNSSKPYKTLPTSDTIRVYDKVPVKALGQEIISNRVVYANYQNKHNPPPSLDYNVLASDKSNFNLKSGSSTVVAIISASSIEIGAVSGSIGIGSIVSSPEITSKISITGITGSTITLSGDVTLTVGAVLKFTASSTIENTTSIVEYPSSSLKANRTYQVGVVLSDKFGRQSTTLLSSNVDVTQSGGSRFSGSTIFVPYIENTVDAADWFGNSIKILFNKAITTIGSKLYNDDVSSINYNPLGWYSLKIVVKQTEQEYYNVYLPGIMASYPENSSLELGNTSHTVLINDNINKVPRDLTEVGPDQKLFRSSVRLFGRVENSKIDLIGNTNVGEGNNQYYPIGTDTVSAIATVDDLFNYSDSNQPQPNYFPQFYSLESTPSIARISTKNKIGQVADLNFNASSAQVSLGGVADLLRIVSVTGDVTKILNGDNVAGPGFPEGIIVDGSGFTPGAAVPNFIAVRASSTGDVIAVSPASTTIPGNLITGLGIPNGTTVLSKVASSPDELLTLSNIVSVTNGSNLTQTSPSTLSINLPVSVQEGDIIQITSGGAPSIERLAVYETEPVDSLLDIFWETTTTGLVNELNFLITNNTDAAGVGASGISTFNTPNFNEGLWSTVSGGVKTFPNINNGTLFLVDSFNQAIPSADIDTDLNISSITNGAGTDVSSYFDLVETSTGSFEYNIRTTAAYEANVYYGDNANLRTFTINFACTVNGLQSVFSETLNLGNVTPFIISPLVPGDTSPVYTADIIVNIGSTTVEDIITLDASNGSGGYVATPANPAPNSKEDLTWSISSEEDQAGTTTTFFAIDSETGKITNTGFANSSMLVSVYTLVIELADSDLTIQRTVKVNTGREVIVKGDVTLPNGDTFGPMGVYQLNYGPNNAGNTAQFTVLIVYVVPLIIPPALIDGTGGCYIYQRPTGESDNTSANPWTTLVNNSNNSSIFIPYNGGPNCNPASTCCEWSGPYSGLFAANPLTAAISSFSGGSGSNGVCGPAGLYGAPSRTSSVIPAPDSDNFAFEVGAFGS